MTVVATTPIERAEKNETQGVDKMETQAQESSSDADPLTETPVPDALRPNLITEVYAHSVANAEVAGMTADASAMQCEMIVTGISDYNGEDKDGSNSEDNGPRRKRAANALALAPFASGTLTIKYANGDEYIWRIKG